MKRRLRRRWWGPKKERITIPKHLTEYTCPVTCGCGEQHKLVFRICAPASRGTTLDRPFLEEAGAERQFPKLKPGDLVQVNQKMMIVQEDCKTLKEA